MSVAKFYYTSFCKFEVRNRVLAGGVENLGVYFLCMLYSVSHECLCINFCSI